MLCTICGKHLHPVNDEAVVWRSVKKSDMLLVWAKLPIHKDCQQHIEREIINSRIRIAAGIPSYIFSKSNPSGKEPKFIGINIDGEYPVEISDGKWEYKKVEGV